jgi:hypothetical protein
MRSSFAQETGTLFSDREVSKNLNSVAEQEVPDSPERREFSE